MIHVLRDLEEKSRAVRSSLSVSRSYPARHWWGTTRIHYRGHYTTRDSAGESGTMPQPQLGGLPLSCSLTGKPRYVVSENLWYILTRLENSIQFSNSDVLFLDTEGLQVCSEPWWMLCLHSSRLGSCVGTHTKTIYLQAFWKKWLKFESFFSKSVPILLKKKKSRLCPVSNENLLETSQENNHQQIE